MKKILKLLSWPVLFGIGQFLIMGFVCFIICSFFQVPFDVQEELKQVVEWIAFPSTLISFIVFGILFYKKYQKEPIHNFSLSKDKIIYYILFGLVTSFVINLFFIKLERMVPIPATLNYMKINYDWFYIGRVVSTVLFGPVLEELLFRGILYQDAQKVMKPMRAILFTTLVFVLFHTTVYSVLTALVTSFLVIDAFMKEKSLTAPILFHIALNATSILLIPLIVRYQTWVLDILFIILLILFVVLYRMNQMKRKDEK